MASDEVHIAELCSRLYGFHCIKEVTDVTIHCGGQQFLCHRSVLAARSTYFECMFRNNCKEYVTGTVTFAGDHMKSDTLVEILKYVYAGNATITTSNFVDLLYAGDYLGVLGLEAYCIRILPLIGPDNIVDHLWKALFTAHTICNPSLISVLASCNLTKRLKEFFNTNEFLRISVDHLVIIVTKLWKSPPTMNTILMSAIHRWGAHALNERKEEVQKLHKRLKSASEKTFKLCLPCLESYPRASSDLQKTVSAAQCSSLYVYARDLFHEANIAYRMSTYRYSCGDPSDKKYVLEYCYQPDTMITDLRLVSVDNVGLFSIAVAVGRDQSTHSMLFQFASENTYGFHSELALTPPPIDPMFQGLNLCNLSNFDFCNLSDRGLYLLDTRYFGRPLRHNPTYDASKQEFSEEEVQRRIYFFNIELDRWLPVPAMLSHPPPCCMTVLDDNVVYVMATSQDNEKVVQAYDHRERKWQNMPSNLHTHFRPQSCVLNGKIYVSSPRHCERYDPVAARWEDVAVFHRKWLDIRRLLPYKDELWHLWSNYFTYSMEMYQPRTDTWSTIQSILPLSGGERVLDAVTWRKTTT